MILLSDEILKKKIEGLIDRTSINGRILFIMKNMYFGRIFPSRVLIVKGSAEVES
jgi:hypothetical protein